MSISLKNISFSYKDPRKNILTDVNFDIEQGERVALLGITSSGKSTVANIIAGNEKPDTGEILISGNTVSFKNPYSNLGLINQNSFESLFPWKKVKETILYPLKLRKLLNNDTVAFAKELTQKLNLDGHEKYYSYKLSGGAKRRLSIGLALVYKPDVVLLDEPFTGIDEILTRELWDFFYDLFEDYQPTVFHITHDLAEAIVLTDKIAFLTKKGEIVLYKKTRTDYGLPIKSRPSELKQHPKFHLYEKDLFDALRKYSTE